MSEEQKPPSSDGACVIPSHQIPAAELGRYSVERDPHQEGDIARYVEIEARNETVEHVELVKVEYVVGVEHEVWDVTTDADRYWVITNFTNLYSQRHFPSLDYTLSFHVGLMMRLRSKPDGANSADPSPFEDVFRRQEQAKARFDRSVEPEDHQAIGMQLREALLSLISAVRRRIELPADVNQPRDADFRAWTDLLANQLCPGESSKTLRQYLKGTSQDTWQLVNWLTHHRNASETASSIAIHACDTVVGHFVQLVQLDRATSVGECPICKSRNVRPHFDPFILPDGDYYSTCGACEWSNHPDERPAI